MEREALRLDVGERLVGDPCAVFAIGKCARDIWACLHVEPLGVYVVVVGT